MKEAERFYTYQKRCIAEWDEIARQSDVWEGFGGYYHKRLEQVYRHVVVPGQRILEIGCRKGDLLAALRPSYGVGIDFSREMIKRARKRYPQLTFLEAAAHDIGDLKEVFDVVVLSDLINDLWDVQKVFENLSRFTRSKTRILMNMQSRLWDVPFEIISRLRLARPRLYQNWLTAEDVNNLLSIAGFETIRIWPEVLLPMGLPILSVLCNRYLVKLWPFSFFAVTNFIMARPQPQKRDIKKGAVGFGYHPCQK
jgi:ubiquinone/menaquinone biosynthesis C-methylase UbiE